MTTQPDRQSGDGLRKEALALASSIDLGEDLGKGGNGIRKRTTEVLRLFATAGLRAGAVLPARNAAEGADDSMRDALTRLATRHVGDWIKESNPVLQMFPTSANQDIRDFVKDVLALILGPPKPAPEAPGHTDLLVSPESIDTFMEKNPLPAPPVRGDREKIAPQKHYFMPKEGEFEACKICGRNFRNAAFHCWGDERPETNAQYIGRLEALLSLRVQPGAGERGRSELEAKFDDIAYRFSCLLDHATGGRMSKTNYTKEDMYTQVNEHISRCGDDLRDEIIDECLDEQPNTAENTNEDAYQRGRFDGIMEFAQAIQDLKRDHGFPRQAPHSSSEGGQ